MNCTICNTVLDTRGACPACGFDPGLDYAKYPTLVHMDGGPSLKSLFYKKQRINVSEGASFQDILLRMAEAFGRSILKDGEHLLAIFSELAPSMVREKWLLRALVECGGNGAIYEEALNKGDPSSALERTVSLLKSVYSLAEGPAREVCQTFLYAVSGHTGQEKMGNESTSNRQTSAPFGRNPATNAAPPRSIDDSWVCSCGYRNRNHRKFCANCDLPSRKTIVPRPESSQDENRSTWVCSCGFRNSTKRRSCENCDMPKR